jgi:hypothetical protein
VDGTVDTWEISAGGKDTYLCFHMPSPKIIFWEYCLLGLNYKKRQTRCQGAGKIYAALYRLK